MPQKPEVFSLWEDRAPEERLSNLKVGSTYVKNGVKPAPHSQEMSCNMVGNGHAHEEVGKAALAT